MSGSRWGTAHGEKVTAGVAVGFGDGHGQGSRSSVPPWGRHWGEVSPT